MKKAAAKVISSGAATKAVQKMWGDEDTIAELKAQSQLDWAHQKTISQPNGTSLPPKTEFF